VARRNQACEAYRGRYRRFHAHRPVPISMSALFSSGSRHPLAPIFRTAYRIAG
jgi:hypothetical protein